MSSQNTFTLRDAASTVVIRENNNAVEVLLLKRAPSLSFGADNWVFPGGKVDKADEKAACDLHNKYKIAALRETQEEAGLVFSPQQLQYFFRITPPLGKVRFNTAFFITAMTFDHPVVVDGSEIVDSVWLTASQALQQFDQGKMLLMVPTGLILMRLAMFDTCNEVLHRLTKAPLFELNPVALDFDGHIHTMVYPGDARFDEGLGLPSDCRHFVTYDPRTSYWQYTHDTDEKLFPPLDGGYTKN